MRVGLPLVCKHNFLPRSLIPIVRVGNIDSDFIMRIELLCRNILRKSLNCSDGDSVIFTGSGCTGAVHKLVHCLGLDRLEKPPVVFVSPFEHHSNLLPWMECASGAEVSFCYVIVILVHGYIVRNIKMCRVRILLEKCGIDT